MATKNTNQSVFPAADQARIQQMQRSWDAYHGRFPRPFKTRTRQPDYGVVVNRCRPICTKIMSYLFGQDVKFEADQDAGPDAQDYLDAVWQQNRQMSLLQKAALNGTVTGHCFIKIVPCVPYPRLVVIDPSIVCVRHSPGDIEDVVEYSITYETASDAASGKPSYVRELITRDSAVSWSITQQTGSGQPNEWVTNSIQPWPYAWPPIADCQNTPDPSSFWGQSSIGPDLIQLNVDLNRVLSDIGKILSLHASPKVIGAGFNVDQIAFSPDGAMILPTTDATMQILEAHSDLVSGLAFAKELSGRMDELSHVPSVSLGTLGDLPRGQISGLALQVVYEPLLETVRMLQRLYGDMLIEICRRLLQMAGYGGAIDVTIHWPSLLPTDDLQDAQSALIYMQLGASKATLLQKLGFDPDLEAQKSAAEQANQVQQRHPSTQLPTALPTLPTDEETNDPAVAVHSAGTAPIGIVAGSLV